MSWLSLPCQSSLTSHLKSWRLDNLVAYSPLDSPILITTASHHIAAQAIDIRARCFACIVIERYLLLQFLTVLERILEGFKFLENPDVIEAFTRP